MDDTSIISEKFSSSLQIDCNLATSTSFTLDSSFTTPKRDNEGNYKEDSSSCSSSSCYNQIETSSEWANLYRKLKRTPPKRTRDPSFDITVELAIKKANNLLISTARSEFQNMTFDNLQDDQKAILLLMIVKGMDTVFEAGIDRTADILLGALILESSENKRMMGFVRKGCDIRYKKTDLAVVLERYARGFETTIFQVNSDMTPFFYLQREDSYICSYNVSAALLYYCSYNNIGTERREDGDKIISTIKMNIGKYVRDEVSGLEIANVTFTTVKGAYLKKVLLGLMKSFGTTDCNQVEAVRIWERSEDDTYTWLRVYLNAGFPFGFCIENFPGLDNKEKMEYTGHVAGYYNNPNERPLRKDRCYHSLLCIGISPRNNDTPPMLLVQDSCSIRPVFSVGLDLLMDMGLRNLELCTVPEEWTFNENAEYRVSPATKALLCGSPMSVDNKGVPYVINTKKPVRKKREDMSCYLHKNVEPVNGVFAFIH